MKQSKKLLSIFLAMLMLLGTVSVIANAAQVKVTKANLAYDSIDNAALTPEQVANTVLDVLDRDLMPGLGTINIPVLGNLNLTSIDNALSSVYGLLDNFIIKAAAVSIKDVKALTNNRDKLNVSRSGNGDLECVYALLDFIGCDEVSQVVSEIVYGVGTDDGISLGGILNSALSGTLEDINDIVMNLDTFVVEMVYDMLIHGSYNAAYEEYDKSYPSVDELKDAGMALPAEVNNLDGLINTAVTNLLTKPQKYEYVPTGEYVTDAEGNQVPVTEKVWDEESYILTADKIAGKDLTLTGNSVFSILDQCLQTAYEDFGTVALNHDLKKIFMEAMEVDFVELDKTNAKDLAEINAAKADPDFINVEDGTPTNAAEVKNYFCNAQMWEVNGTWYFRDYVTRPVLDANGNIQYDAEGNQITALQHRYQRAEAYNVNDLYYIFNWDYKLTDTTFNFDQLIPQYGSIIGCLNHILHVILETAINPAALGISSIEELWADGGNDQFNENLMKTAKFLLKNFTFEFFGRNPLYVDLDTLKANDAFIEKVDTFGNDAAGREGLIAYMLLPFLGDALPQLVYDLDMFTAELQIEQVAALLVREFLSDLTPQINYDDQIFVDASLKSGRQFKTYTSAQWFELILNMGLDLAAVYLDNISNFNVNLTTLETIKGYAVAAGAPAYMGVLEEIVDWAVDYIADGTSMSVLAGCEPATLGSVRCVTAYDQSKDTVTVANNYAGNAFTILSTVLNKILPLGLLCGVSSDAYALDVKMAFDKVIDIIDDLDLEVLLGLFGRNNRDDNLLGATNVVKQILGLVNKLISCLFGNNLFDPAYTTSLNSAITDASLQMVVKNLLRGLNSRKEALLRSALPVVAVFVDDWGSEQALRSPELGIERVVPSNYGSLNTTIKLYNGSRGLWRGYMQNGTRAQDEQYVYEIQGMSSLQGIGISGSYTGELTKGNEKSLTFTGTIPETGLADRIDISYKIKNEEGQYMDNGKVYIKSYYVYFAYNPADYHYNDNEDDEVWMTSAITFDITSSTLVEDIKATFASNEVEGIARWYNGADGNKTMDYTNKGTATQGAFTSTTQSWSQDGDNTKHMNPFTFNESAFNLDDIGVGAAYNFTHTLFREFKPLFQGTKTCGWRDDRKTAIILYNGQLKGELEDYVNEQVDLDRQAADYSNNDAYMAYLGALAEAMCSAYNPMWNASINLDFATLKANLEAAVANLEQYKIPADQQSGDTVSSLINQLETTLNSVEDGFGGKDYRTYMLYRWHRYQDAKKDANRAIELQKEYNAGLQTTKFEYSSMPVYQLKNAVAGDQYEGYILALLKNLNEEELAEATEHFKNVTKDYSGYTTLDIAQLSNLVTRMSGRLLPREGGVVNTYLSKEIESARAEIGTTNTAGYSTRSWNAYSDAFTKAEAAMTSASQDVIFAAKYALQVARNNLRTEANEADYEELQALIDQANVIFWNPALYDNTPAEIGALLGALGYTTTNGTDTVIFPNAAKIVNARSYDKGDQDEVDDAADALKAALSKMVFKGANYGSNTVTESQVPTGEVDENDVAITESVKTTVLDAKQILSAVKAQFGTTTATGATDTEVRISLDDNYTLENGNDKFVGTGATITIYTTQSGVKIPLSTIKVVVKGDVTGDGVIDVLDCMVVELAGTNYTTVSGVYSLAGDLAENGKVGLDDLGQVANLAKAG